MKEFIKFIMEEAFNFGKGLNAVYLIYLTAYIIKTLIKRSVNWIGNKINEYRRINTIYK